MFAKQPDFPIQVLESALSLELKRWILVFANYNNRIHLEEEKSRMVLQGFIKYSISNQVSGHMQGNFGM